MSAPAPRRNVLLVEDNPVDVLLTREGLKDAGGQANLTVVADGDEALAFLRRQGRWVDAERPNLILLDLNLPGTSGREVLAEIKANEALRTIPVLVLSGSSCPDDISAAYELHANCYLVKPLELVDWVRLMQAIETFWLTAAELPGAVGR